MEPRQHLRSSSSPALVVPASRRSSLGDRAFLVAAAKAWNSLLSTVTAASTLRSFRRTLKTHLFTASFPPPWANVIWLHISWPCSLLTLRHPNLFFFTLHYIIIQVQLRAMFISCLSFQVFHRQLLKHTRWQDFLMRLYFWLQLVF